MAFIVEEYFFKIYLNLKNNIGKRITINYYSENNYLKKESVKLLNVINFSHIVVNKEQNSNLINFFGPDTLIESIIVDGETNPIYFNHDIQKHINKKTHIINYEEIKKDFFGNMNPTGDLEKRWYFIQKLKKRGDFEFEELFFSDKQRKEFDDFFKILTKELSEYAEKQGLDSNLIPIGSGTTTLAYCIGDKIIKIGKPRTYTTIPYCEYLLQPIVNRDFEFNYIPMRIEITEKVITLKDKPELKKEFEDIVSNFKEKLLNIGLQLYDLSVENIGILMKDNIIHFDSIPFETGNAIATSIEHNNNLRVRKKGEPIIIDLDSLEVVDVNKYCEYLRNIGFDEYKIKEVKAFYAEKRKIKYFYLYIF